jgi:DNA-directed RNA polymerase subunit RPC12/RpoP
MNCPNCNHVSTSVLQTNAIKTEHTTRQRKCSNCGHKWFTVELEVQSWAIGWEKLSTGFGGKPTLRVPVQLLYGEDDA